MCEYTGSQRQCVGRILLGCELSIECNILIFAFYFQPIAQVLRDEDCPSMIVPSRPCKYSNKNDSNWRAIRKKSWYWMILSTSPTALFSWLHHSEWNPDGGQKNPLQRCPGQSPQCDWTKRRCQVSYKDTHTCMWMCLYMHAGTYSTHTHKHFCNYGSFIMAIVSCSGITGLVDAKEVGMKIVEDYAASWNWILM